jgi:hypothetical protein
MRRGAAHEAFPGAQRVRGSQCAGAAAAVQSAHRIARVLAGGVQ